MNDTPVRPASASFFPMNETTFGALYCAQRKIDQADYEKTVLNETMYPHAKLVAPIIRLLWPRHFVADHDFVQSVARLRRFREFFNESEDFAHHPENVGFSRATLNLRVSSRRMRRLVREVLHPELTGLDPADDHSAAPFQGKKGDTGTEAAKSDPSSGTA